MTTLHGELGGRYRLGELLAVGGQGSVYLAVDELDGRELVVKVALAPGDGRARLASLRLAGLAEDPRVGPHLVPVWDVGVWGDRDFVVLERLERTLGERPDDERLLRALVAAVAALGAAGVVHGDLKPSNVFVRDDGEEPAVLLGDLWCGEGPAPVSVGFGAPELWRGGAPSLAADRYALGATIWAVLAGGPPPAALAGPHAVRPTRRELAEAGIGAPWDQVLSSLLDPDPRRRPAPDAVLSGRRRASWVAPVVVALAFVAVGLALLPPGDEPVTEAPPGVVLVPAGSFVQGAAEGDRVWAVDAVQRRVTLTRPVWFRKTEITQQEYREALGSEPVRERDETLPDGSVVPCSTWEGHVTVGDDLPVACVSWFDAVRLANALSARDGLAPAYEIDGEEVRWDRDAPGWRLPTEAEWEWAASGAGRDAYAGAGSRDAVCSHANVRAQDAPEHWGNEVPCSDGAPVLAPVGSQAPNPLGLYDMLGNVAEWTWDRWADRSPAAVTDPAGPEVGRLRVYRGSAWNQIARPVTARYAGDPHGYGLNGGIRLVRNATP